jgi:hypothetical protein
VAVLVTVFLRPRRPVSRGASLCSLLSVTITMQMKERLRRLCSIEHAELECIRPRHHDTIDPPRLVHRLSCTCLVELIISSADSILTIVLIIITKHPHSFTLYPLNRHHLGSVGLASPPIRVHLDDDHLQLVDAASFDLPSPSTCSACVSDCRGHLLTRTASRSICTAGQYSRAPKNLSVRFSIAQENKVFRLCSGRGACWWPGGLPGA